MSKKPENLPHVGSRLLNRYRLISEIGEGPSGYLFKALDMALDIPVAVKIFRKEFFSERNRDINLLRIYRARAYQHEAIVKIFEFQEEGGWHFITTQLIEGFSLRMIMDFHRETGEYFTIPKISSFLLNIVESLSFIHKIGIHGNLKPENIYILAERLKLSDPYHLVGGEIKEGEEIPLHEYYKPIEQLQNPLDERRSFDLYSLALIMGEIISNNPVKPTIPLSEQIPHLTGTLDSLFLKATATSLEDRFKEIDEFRSSLLDALAVIEREGIWIRKYHETGSFKAIIPKAAEVEPLKPIETIRAEERVEIKTEIIETAQKEVPSVAEQAREEAMFLEVAETMIAAQTAIPESALIKELEEVSKKAEELEVIKEEELTDVTSEEVETIMIEEVEEEKPVQIDDGIEIEGEPQVGETQVLTALKPPDDKVIPPVPEEETLVSDQIISVTKPVEITAQPAPLKKEKPVVASSVFLMIALIVIIAGASILIYLKITSTEVPEHPVQTGVSALESKVVSQTEAVSVALAVAEEVLSEPAEETAVVADIQANAEIAAVEEVLKPEEEAVQPVQVEPTAKKEVVLAADLKCPAGMRKVVVNREMPKEQFRKTTELAYCIDPFEFPGKGVLPSTGVSRESAAAACNEVGKRLCFAHEWRRACGARYSYGSELVLGRCNTGTVEGEENEIVTAGSFPECRSGYGLYDMIGNAGEWTAEGFVMGGDSRKEPEKCTCGSSTKYRGVSPFIGFRCCADPKI